MRWFVCVLAACGGVESSEPLQGRTTTPGAPQRWVYRVYMSGVESNHERVTTFVIDRRAGTVDASLRTRDGRGDTPWLDGSATHWKLAVSGGPDLRLSLTGADATELRYACKRHTVQIAPAAATRASLGGESTWKQGRWTVPTRSLAVQICEPEGDVSAGPAELVLAPEPIEHLRADDNCCGDSPSLRAMPADGTVLPPRDPSFPQVE